MGLMSVKTFFLASNTVKIYLSSNIWEDGGEFVKSLDRFNAYDDSPQLIPIVNPYLSINNVQTDYYSAVLLYRTQQ